MKNLIPICTISKESILCFCNCQFYAVNTISSEIILICNLSESRLRRTFMRFKLLRRFYGLYSIRGIKVTDNKFLIHYHHQLYLLDIARSQIDIIDNGMKYAVLHFSSSSMGPIWGEYGYNPSKNSKRIFRYNATNNQIETLYAFHEGEINHVHNIIEDTINGRFYILTGDFDNSAGIYYTDDKFETVKPLVYGSQDYRSCFAIPYEDTLVYATDSPTQINHLYSLSKGGLTTITELNGSCIFACRYGDYFIGSTTVENEPDENNNAKNRFRYNLGRGIKDWNVELFSYNLKSKEYKVLLRAKKDIFPMLAFGYGLFVLPVIDSLYTGKLMVYGQSIKEYDQKLLQISLD